MDSWHNHLANTIALHTRGKNLEEHLGYKSLLGKTLSATEVTVKMARALEIEKLYTKADRMCRLLARTQEKGSKFNLDALQTNIEDSLRRISDIRKILNFKAKKWGLNEEDTAPDTYREPPVFEDVNLVQDNPYTKMFGVDSESQDESVDLDSLRTEVKAALKALMDVVDYMESPTLSKIQKRLDKLVEY